MYVNSSLKSAWSTFLGLPTVRMYMICFQFFPQIILINFLSLLPPQMVCDFFSMLSWCQPDYLSLSPHPQRVRDLLSMFYLIISFLWLSIFVILHFSPTYDVYHQTVSNFLISILLSVLIDFRLYVRSHIRYYWIHNLLDRASWIFIIFIHLCL